MLNIYILARPLAAIVGCFLVTLTAVPAVESASTSYGYPSSAQVARWDAEFDALAAARVQNVFRIRVVDQTGRPVPNFPVWISDATYKPKPVSSVLAGGSGLTVLDETIPTNADGVATYTGGGSYSFTFGVNGRFVRLPWIIPAVGNDASADCLQGLRSSADSERDIREGRQAPRPNQMTAMVYKVEGKVPTLWSIGREVVELQDPAPKGFAAVPLVFFECSRAFPRRDVGRPQTPSEWAESRRIRDEDALPWAHFLVQGGVLPAAVTGRQAFFKRPNREATPWWFELQAGGADLQLVAKDDRFPLVAPENGYVKAIRWEIPAQQDDIRQWLWVRIHGTPVRYGCWEMRARRKDINPDNTNPAKITLEGPIYLNPTGSRHLERWLNNSQSDEWRDLLTNPTVSESGKPIPSKMLFPDKPIDVTGVERLPMQTIVIPPPDAPAPTPPPLSPEEQAKLEAQWDAEELARQMAEYQAEQAAASASAAKP